MVKNPFRYRGYYYDNETKWYYLNSRYYDLEVGRFINADDASILKVEQGSPDQYNLFAYWLNNPVNMEDPNEYVPFLIVVGIAVAKVAKTAATAKAVVATVKVITYIKCCKVNRRWCW